MSRLVCSGLLVFGPALCSAQATAPQPPVFAAQVDSVFIDAFTTNTGSHSARLEARDFVLRDNGAPATFDLVPTDSLPLRAILVFDTSSSMQGAKLDRLRASAGSFLDQLRPEDEAGLLSFSEEITWLALLSTDHARVRDALGRLRPFGATSAYDALFTALVTPRSALRTLVILFSDGEDNASWLREGQVKRLIERSNALIYVVAANSEYFSGFIPKSGPSRSPHMMALRGFAEITGGSLIEVESPQRIEGAFAQIVTAMKNRYILRYAPETEPTPGWHKLDLQLKSGGKVAGRNGYWVEKR